MLLVKAVVISGLCPASPLLSLFLFFFFSLCFFPLLFLLRWGARKKKDMGV